MAFRATGGTFDNVSFIGAFETYASVASWQRPRFFRSRLLADMIGRTLCDPSETARTAKATQEIPGDWAYRVPIGYGSALLNGDWSRCGRPKADLSDPTSGGDARHSADLLRRLAR